MRWEDFATPGSKTLRKAKRRDIRMTLGSSSDPAPTAIDALDAAYHLDDLLRRASSGRFSLKVQEGDRILTPGQAATAAAATKRQREDAAVESAEPAPGFVIRGRYADGSFRLFARTADGAQTYLGQYPSYDCAAEVARGRT